MTDYLKTFDIGFYKTKLWLDKRFEILIRDNHECQHCKQKGIVSSPPDVILEVHHKIPYQERPDLALADDNLITLCQACHNKIHSKGFKAKKKKLVHEERWE